MSDAPIVESSATVDFWNRVLVPKFARYRHILVGGLSLHSAKIFPSLPLRPGDRVVDIGCGFGDTAIRLAERVGPSGYVLGVDCCEAFLAYGRRDAAAAGLVNVGFLEADVLRHQFRPEFDFCFSRFGTQFFDNPVAGLRSMRRSLRPGGIMTMIVWRALEDNPWLALPKEVVLRYLPPVKAEAESCGPGPFSMASPRVFTEQLKAAGYVDIAFEQIDATLMVGRDADDAAAFQLAIGPAGEVYREAGDEAARRHDEIAAALKTELSRYLGPGGVMMESSSWKVSARNPG